MAIELDGIAVSVPVLNLVLKELDADFATTAPPSGDEVSYWYEFVREAHRHADHARVNSQGLSAS